MPAIVTDDGVKLHAEETGQGEPLLFVHEFVGDHCSWEPQVRFFSAAYRSSRLRSRPKARPGSPNGTRSAGPGPVPEQEPARLGRVRRGAGRAFLAWQRPDHARRPGRPASLYALTDELAQVSVPVLVLVATRTRAAWSPR